MKRILTLAIALMSIAGMAAGNKYSNAVIRADVPDPTIMRIGDKYFAAGTSSEWAPYYPVFESSDLVNWKQIGHVFDKKPEWVSHSLWAPEFFYHNGKIYCYYCARRASDSVSCVGVAVADAQTPTNFVDHGVLIDFGKESIDPYVWEVDGQLYISWKSYGLDYRPIEISGQKLSADGLHLEGERFMMLRDDEQIGMEGQSHFKYGDYHYIVYAARGCCGFGSDYEVRVARSKTVDGVYEKFPGNPILHGDHNDATNDYVSIGHGSIVNAPDGRMFYLSHAYLKHNQFFMGRQPVLHELVMTPDQWVAVRTGDKAQVEIDVPFAGTKQVDNTTFHDDFKGKTLRPEWTWCYPHTNIDFSLKGGKLSLSGTPTADGYYSGNALCVRPSKPNYEVTTRIAKYDSTIEQGLTLYGDNDNMLRWTVKGNTLRLCYAKDGVEKVLYNGAVLKEPFLKIQVVDGYRTRFLYSADGKKWHEAMAEEFDGRFLMRWDRVYRPGLVHNGNAQNPAMFHFFDMK